MEADEEGRELVVYWELDFPPGIHIIYDKTMALYILKGPRKTTIYNKSMRDALKIKGYEKSGYMGVQTLPASISKPQGVSNDTALWLLTHDLTLYRYLAFGMRKYILYFCTYIFDWLPKGELLGRQAIFSTLWICGWPSWQFGSGFHHRQSILQMIPLPCTRY